jgi:hypothetical protein
MTFPGTRKHTGNRWHGGVPAMRRWLDALVVEPSGCLTWGLSLTSAGYGSLLVDGRTAYAHRFAYESFVGPIPDDQEIDHLCRNRACNNPTHLEAVTRRINQIRGVGLSGTNYSKTHCDNGHAFDTANTYIRTDGNHPGRQCRTCHADRARARAAATSAVACGRGHMRTPENTYRRTDGISRCLTCTPGYGAATS